MAGVIMVVISTAVMAPTEPVVMVINMLPTNNPLRNRTAGFPQPRSSP